ncbi:translocation protein SEC62-like [Limulus polyphemus]|uniref:Translocation protein SEC62 n=1 Tax=Limulus polyphemus TaxID=6850 RepID=A0ABM1AZR6_LIMPO|nr:translocation protein SEC62-like [Limulus polyphemus]
MAERRKTKRKKEQLLSPKDEKPSKVEYDIAKYLRQKLPVKKTSLLSHKVEYFIASKAVDCLLDSPWSTGKNKTEILFTTRDCVADYMDMMLRHKFFHRARKIIIQKEPKKKNKEKEEENTADEVKEKEKMKEKHKEKDTKSEKEDKELEGKKEGEEGEKKKKKIKLDMHLEQVFLDGNEAYVWIYDPIPLKVWIAGTFLVLGAIALCLFPLWPRIVRHYVYYLSVAAAGFLVFIIALAVLRMVVFIIIWLLTFGKHHLWLLPNLTEDVGFFESFWPLYHYEYKGRKQEIEDSKGSNEKEKAGSGSKNDDRHSKEQQNTESEGENQNFNENDSSVHHINGDDDFEIVEPKEDLTDEHNRMCGESQS